MQDETKDSGSTENKSNTSGAESSEAKDKTTTESGDPGRTPGSAEGDEETVDADIRQKEREGKL